MNTQFSEHKLNKANNEEKGDPFESRTNKY